MCSRLRHFAKGVWTRPAGGGRKKVSAQRFRSRKSGEQVSRCVGVERLKSENRVAEEGKSRQEGESDDLGMPVELQWRDGMESGVCCWSCRTLWRERVLQTSKGSLIALSIKTGNHVRAPVGVHKINLDHSAPIRKSPADT